MRLRRSDYAKMLAAQTEVARAEDDYHRLRAAYLKVAQDEPGHEVALAMVGSDMDRAHAVLQSLIGISRVPFLLEPAANSERAQPSEAEST